MQVPREIRESVVFLACNTTNGLVVGGTAFVIDQPMEEDGDLAEFRYQHVVTAKHNLQQVEGLAVDGNVLLLCNLRGGGTELIETPLDKWYVHPDDEWVDVAAIDVNLPMDHFDYHPIPTYAFVVQGVRKDLVVDLGDELAIVGLFRMHRGRARNIPIVRIGNVAGFPEEKLPASRDWGPQDAYLMEARSLGGMSGSPVFHYANWYRTVGNEVKVSTDPPIFSLLGLVHGHWDINPENAGSFIPQPRINDERINMGLAIVVPADKILEVVNQEERAAMRDKEKEHLRQIIRDERSHELDSGFTAGDVGLTREEFLAALRRVSRPSEDLDADTAKE